MECRETVVGLAKVMNHSTYDIEHYVNVLFGFSFFFLFNIKH